MFRPSPLVDRRVPPWKGIYLSFVQFFSLSFFRISTTRVILYIPGQRRWHLASFGRYIKNVSYYIYWPTLHKYLYFFSSNTDIYIFFWGNVNIIIWTKTQIRHTHTHSPTHTHAHTLLVHILNIELPPWLPSMFAGLDLLFLESTTYVSHPRQYTFVHGRLDSSRRLFSQILYYTKY